MVKFENLDLEYSSFLWLNSEIWQMLCAAPERPILKWFSVTRAFDSRLNLPFDRPVTTAVQFQRHNLCEDRSGFSVLSTFSSSSHGRPLLDSGLSHCPSKSRSSVIHPLAVMRPASRRAVLHLRTFSPLIIGSSEDVTSPLSLQFANLERFVCHLGLLMYDFWCDPSEINQASYAP